MKYVHERHVRDNKVGMDLLAREAVQPVKDKDQPQGSGKEGNRGRDQRSTYIGRRPTRKAGLLGSQGPRRDGSSNAGKQGTSSRWIDPSIIKLNGAELS